MELNENWLARVVLLALEEDIGLGDITTQATVPREALGRARIWAKEEGVIAGLPVAEAVFCEVHPDLEFSQEVEDGELCEYGRTIATVVGPMQPLLTAERTALNFLQRLSGIATVTRKMVGLIAHTNSRVVDTRKTTPGLRMLEKYAVAVGGGANHRWALDSGVLIKDNHLKAAGGVGPAVKAARARAPHSLAIQVECKEVTQVAEAVESGADVVMLDNMRGDTLLEALQIVDGHCRVEVSGGINASNIETVALPGVDLISVGALTHSASSIDIALDVEEVTGL